MANTRKTIDVPDRLWKTLKSMAKSRGMLLNAFLVKSLQDTVDMESVVRQVPAIGGKRK